MTPPRLAHLHDVTGNARLPAYDPSAHGVGIVHLGLGAFHRAHQAAMTDAALAASGGDWRITGISLRSTAMRHALAPQNGLYTLLTRGTKGTRARVIGALAGVIAADKVATLLALCEPAVRVVTLTVSEKGYGVDRATGEPDPSHPAVVADLADPGSPSGTLGLLAGALGRRRAAGIPPFSVLSCDNLPENGMLLAKGVAGFARAAGDAALADWIATNVAFPSSMVDRITPAATEKTLVDAAHATGCTDLAAVEAEAFCQWVIEDDFPQGRPAWEAGGAIFVADVMPYERMKLTMLNGTHSMLAYAGILAGHRYVRDVMADCGFAKLVMRHLKAAAAELPPLEDLDLAAYAADLADRFRNPGIAHETSQIAMDGSEKMPQRIFAPALSALDNGHNPRPFAFATAAWMAYLAEASSPRSAYPLRDPREAEIRAALGAAQPEAEAVLAATASLPRLVPERLYASSTWRAEVAEVLGSILETGMPATIDRELRS